MPVAALSLNGIDALARHHWSWIGESFLHVSILQEWGERTLSERISDQYSSEIPRAFRMINLMLESRSRITLCDEDAFRERAYLPDPGRSVRLMAKRELLVMQGFDSRLRSMSEEYGHGNRGEIAEILSEAIASRSEYMAWLRDRIESLTEASERLCRVPDDLAWKPLNSFLIQLMHAIDETSIHMLVLRHQNQLGEAERSWQHSYEYMLLAVEIARFLGRREWALDLSDKTMIDQIRRPRIGETIPEILQISRERQSDLEAFAKYVTDQRYSGPDIARGDSETEALIQKLASRVSTFSNRARVSGPSMEAMLDRYRYLL